MTVTPGLVDCLATKPWYWRHMEPVWNLLPDGVRGALIKPDGGYGIPSGDRPTLVASWTDAQRVRRAILMEHGAGQSYGGDPGARTHPSYAGGDDRANVILSLVPGPHPQARERAAGREAVAIGCPALDRWLDAPSPVPGRVALAFHWPCRLCPESDWAFPHYQQVLGVLAQRFDLVGHGHPRAMRRLNPHYGRAGIPSVGYDDAMRAEVLVVDNSSLGFEAAAAGRRVVWLDTPWYRIDHGLRFFDACPDRVGGPADLPDAIQAALDGAYGLGTDVGAVYSYLDGTAAQRAADAVMAAVAELAA